MTTPTTTPSGETYDQTVNTLATLQDQLVDMAEGFVRALPNMAIALVIIVITWIVARIAVRGVSRAIGKTDMRPSLQNLIDTVVKLGIWIVGLMIALIVVMPGMTPASLIAGLGIGAVAIGFAFQDIFENFLAGVLIMLREKMRIGDVIECEGIIGKVEHITLRETHVRKLSGEVTLVPNSMLFKNPVEILTDEQMRRHEVIAGVSYDTGYPQGGRKRGRGRARQGHRCLRGRVQLKLGRLQGPLVGRFDPAQYVGEQGQGDPRDQARLGRCGDRNPVPLHHPHLQGVRAARPRSGRSSRGLVRHLTAARSSRKSWIRCAFTPRSPMPTRLTDRMSISVRSAPSGRARRTTSSSKRMYEA